MHPADFLVPPEVEPVAKVDMGGGKRGGGTGVGASVLGGAGGECQCVRVVSLRRWDRRGTGDLSSAQHLYASEMEGQAGGARLEVPRDLRLFLERVGLKALTKLK